MKMNKSLVIALAAGVAVTGLVAFLLTTEKGKGVTKNWKNKGEKFAGSIEDILDSAKKKFASLKEDVLSECKKTPQVVEEP